MSRSAFGPRRAVSIATTRPFMARHRRSLAESDDARRAPSSFQAPRCAIGAPHRRRPRGSAHTRWPCGGHRGSDHRRFAAPACTASRGVLSRSVSASHPRFLGAARSPSSMYRLTLAALRRSVVASRSDGDGGGRLSRARAIPPWRPRTKRRRTATASRLVDDVPASRHKLLLYA